MNDLVAFRTAQTILPDDVTPAMMAQVLREFMTGFAPTSRVTMRYALQRSAEDMGFGMGLPIEQVPWHRVTAQQLSELLYHWRDRLDRSTIRLYMHSVRGIARACFIRGLMPADQYALLGEVKLPRGRNKSGRGRSVALQYREQLLNDCMNDERIQGVRDAAMIALLFGSGIRRAEAVSLQDEHLDLDAAEFKVRVKGGDYVTRYLAAWALPYLKTWREVRLSNEVRGGPFLCRIWKGGRIAPNGITGRSLFYLLEDRCKRAGLPFLVRPHDARRTMGTEMLSQHGELLAQKVLGHADLSTTRIYDKRSDAVIKDIFSRWS